MSDVLHIVIDTREQMPWSFDPSHALTRVGTLRTGDYALAGDEGFAIERKSLEDFLGTVATGWERFSRELERMQDAKFPARVVIVEGDAESVFFHESDNGIQAPRHNHPRLSPGFITKRIAELTMMGVTVLFAGRPEYASALAYRILKERHNAITCKG